MWNNNMHQHISIEDKYKIFCEKCEDEGIKPPTFKEFCENKSF